MRQLILSLLVLITLLGCRLGSEKKKLIDLRHKGQAPVEVVVAFAERPEAIIRAAKNLNLEVKGERVLTIRGPADSVRQIEIDPDEPALAVVDDSMVVVHEGDAFLLDEEIFYLAKRDFGLPSYWDANPDHDGRGVVVGVIDDGISPIHSGLQITSTGERKYIAHASQSSFYRYQLLEVGSGIPPTAFLQSVNRIYHRAWQGLIAEEDGAIGHPTGVDINGNGENDEFATAVLQRDAQITVCIDSNANSVADVGECFGTFRATGEYGFWNREHLLVNQAEFDIESAVLSVSEGEAKGDSHGEGVASVLTGHKIGGQFDGVAPGSELIDYDLGENTREDDEWIYTMATFVRALDWMGQNGAEVVNISYSLFFQSAASQRFMKEALSRLVAQYNFVISFSAGNNGPGLGSFNRGLIYPKDVLVAGAFVSKDLDEHVHGVTGLPEPGRVVWYSSRGPAPDGAATPVVISPLASLTHRDATSGFGAFSGTSSASPALAGLAAVLISAAKSLELPIDARAITHAIRQSAVPLTGVPYVEQGAGLPKIKRALASYKEIIAGKRFAYLKSTLGATGPDGVRSSGLVLRTSQNDAIVETVINTEGVLSQLVDNQTGTDLLKPVRIEYSQPWVSGPSHSFVSIGRSRQYIKVDIPQLLASLEERGRDHFAEISFFDKTTDDLLHIVPITVIDDVPLTKPITAVSTLEPEEGERHHLFVPAGTDGFRIDTKTIEGNPNLLGIRVYNPSATSISYKFPRRPTSEVFVPTESPGWYQVTFFKYQGTAHPITVEANIAPFQLRLTSVGLAVSDPKLEVKNLAVTTDAKIRLQKRPERVDEKLVAAPIQSWARETFIADREGFYRLKAVFGERSDVSYPRPACIVKVIAADGNVVHVTPIWSTIDITADLVGSSIELACRPFEYTTLDNANDVLWHFSAHRSATKSPTVLSENVVRLQPGTTTIPISLFDGNADLTPGTEVDVSISPVFTAGESITIGTVLTY